METKETKILLASQKEAQRVLTDARDEAQRLLVEAHEKAMALLLRQQDEAARLLLKQQDEAKVNSFQSMTDAMQLPTADGTPCSHSTERTRMRYWTRSKSRRSFSYRLKRTLRSSFATRSSAPQLMSSLTSHKRAASILLGARMQVIDEWKGNETPPGSGSG